MFGLGTAELVVILVIVVIIFGVGKLPEIGGGIGKAIKNFKKATTEPELEARPAEKHVLESPKVENANKEA